MPTDALSRAMALAAAGERVALLLPTIRGARDRLTGGWVLQLRTRARLLLPPTGDGVVALYLPTDPIEDADGETFDVFVDGMSPPIAAELRRRSGRVR